MQPEQQPHRERRPPMRKDLRPPAGIGQPTTIDQRDSDGKIDHENNNVDRTVKKICKNC
ncbi:hypothetical protein [Bradyrhizobium sp. B120]|uniref:hypothetical protein n=1 Tax=Bradyrhizobium sp. B120 TaxID=3410088 RepID=UPI003B982EC8